MPRINRRARTVAAPRSSRREVLELLLGPNGASVFRDEAQREDAWMRVQRELSDEFAAQWHAAEVEHKPYVALAEDYARQVAAGEIPACQWVRLACQRHLDDCARAQSEEDSPFCFDAAKAARACKFIELLPHVKGQWAMREERVRLEPWQCFILCSIFGWLKRATGARRFSLAAVFVPRKNAKSTLAAGIGLYCMAADEEFGAEIYSGATTEKQAWEVFRPAHQMMERSPELAQVLGIRGNTPGSKRLSVASDGSRFEPVVRTPGDGASPHVGIVDEYHEHDTDVLVDTFRTGMGARQQPLLLIITTAGTNLAGPCKLEQTDLEKVLEGSVQREEAFAIMYGLDADDDWTSPDALRKANPNYGVSVSEEFLRTEQKAAILNPRKQGIFQTKHLDVWVGADEAYFDALRWKALGNPRLSLDDFIGDPCVVSLDLTNKKDPAARILMFRRIESGKAHYYVFPTIYLPSAQIQRPDAQHYQGWAKQGYIVTHEGSTVDFDAIERETADAIERYQAREFCFDPWNAAQLAQGIARRTRAETIEIRQNVQNLSAPMKELDALIADGRVHSDGNPVLTWMISNVTAHEDANENVFPRKEGDENKIDGAVATIMALSRLWLANKRSVYEERGLLVA